MNRSGKRFQNLRTLKRRGAPVTSDHGHSDFTRPYPTYHLLICSNRCSSSPSLSSGQYLDACCQALSLTLMTIPCPPRYRLKIRAGAEG